MSTTPPRTSTNDNTPSSTYRVNYSEYVADITGSPKASRKSAATGIGHHINPLHNPYPNRQNQPIQPTGGMPQYGGGSEKCARCSKTVYLAEKKVGAGRSFHSSCFSCYTCKRKLDSTALSEHKGEIYCKSCYTKQFGAHGLISGVTMSTEQTATRDERNARRSSYANDLDAPGVPNQQARPRTYSNDDNIRDEYINKQNDEVSPKYQPRNDILPEQKSPSNKKNNGVDAIVGTKYPRTPSPLGFERVVEPNTNNNRHRSTYAEEDDRSKYVYVGEKLSYGSGTSAIVDIPIVSHTKHSDSTTGGREIPIERTRDNQRSRSPSVTSNDSYRRQDSRERQTDFTDVFSRVNINADNQKYPIDNTLNTIASENPLTRNYHQSSASSAYETKYKSTTLNPNHSDREDDDSRESSPLPSSGYVASSATRTTSSSYKVESSRDSTLPSSTYVPQYDQRNSQTSSNSNFSDRRSSSPHYNDRTSTGLNDFVSKTNLVETTSTSSVNKNSTLSALVGNIRQPYNQDDVD